MSITFPHIYICFFSSDFDECSAGIDGCTQICIDIVEGFYCECYPGFELDSDGATCIGEYYMTYVHTEKHNMYVHHCKK